MRRHDYQLAPSGREAVRKERRRTWGLEVYRVQGESVPANNVSLLDRFDDGNAAPLEARDHYSHAQPADPGSAKLVYLETVRALLRDRLQATWGRVQQCEELEYDRIVDLVLARAHVHLAKNIGKILEEFEGFLEKFDSDVAYVTLKTPSGEILHGEYPAVELKAKGIREHRRFKCWTVEVGTDVKFVVAPIPDQQLSKEREWEIRKLLEESLGDDAAEQNDY